MYAVHLSLPGVTVDPTRRTAFVAGALYLLTFVSSIPAVGLLAPVLNDPSYVLGAGADGRVLLGGLLDLVNAAACVGTAVVLFPVVRRQHQATALGFVAARLMEAAIIAIGVVSLFAVVTLRRAHAAGGTADPGALVAVASALVALRDWTFLLGPSLVPAVNALLLGTLLLRSGLVPRAIPLLGLVGAPLQISAVLGTVLGVNAQVSVWSAIAVAPIFVWELSLGVWLAAKGFRPSPVTAGLARAEAVRVPTSV